jgi:hypothetical protein
MGKTNNSYYILNDKNEKHILENSISSEYLNVVYQQNMDYITHMHKLVQIRIYKQLSHDITILVDKINNDDIQKNKSAFVNII